MEMILEIPNEKTVLSIKELKENKNKVYFYSIEDLLKDLEDGEELGDEV